MRILYIIILLALNICANGQKLSIYDLSCESKNDPLGIDNVNPRLGWKISGSGRNILQTAYTIRVASSQDFAKKNIVWESGKVSSGESILQPYGGPVLQADQKYYWQVKVWDNTNRESPWSATAFWQMGLLKSGDWKAQWIQGVNVADSVNGPALLFRKQFALSRTIRSATAYITAHGVYEAHINGKRVGDAVLAPGWTSYNKRLQYQAYDVTSLLKAGENAIGVSVGSGWYRTPLAWDANRNIYGKTLALLLQLHVTYSDGTENVIVSDGSWKSTDDGPVRVSEIYDGEVYDARAEKNGWTAVGFDDARWKGTETKDYSKDVLITTWNEPIRKHETFKAIKVIKTPKGEQVIDFGQNVVGWVQVKASGKAGTKIVISHAEVLDREGNFYVENLRGAAQQNTFILKGSGDEMFEPHFTFQGFRYIKVEGYPGELKPENFTAVALYSDMKPSGTFTTSNELLNQLQHNIQWGQKGNFLDVPTDCPQRDERLGWTGDAQVFSRTASFNMDVHNFFAKWLKDVQADQHSNGAVPPVIPNVLGNDAAGSTGWADAATIIPWNMYRVYADQKILEDQYASMKAWEGFMETNSKDYLWNKGFHFGDWLFFSRGDDTDGSSAVTDKYLIAQCFWAHSTQLLINTARVLGKKDDEQRYTALLQKIKDAFVKEYLTSNGRLVSGTQTAYVLALNFDMLPESLRPQAADRLVENVRRYDNHLTTGFLGTPYLCHVLTRFGHIDVAYKLLLQETYPSWLYPVKMGATTIWERWDGQRTDGTFQNKGMNSFNHYAYGAIGDWMYRAMAGIDTDAESPGYRHSVIKPHPGGGITSVAATYESGYGRLGVQWKADQQKFTLDVEVPSNTRATIWIPASSPANVKEGGKPLSSVKELKVLGTEDGYIKVEVGSGKYGFIAEQ